MNFNYLASHEAYSEEHLSTASAAVLKGMRLVRKNGLEDYKVLKIEESEDFPRGIRSLYKMFLTDVLADLDKYLESTENMFIVTSIDGYEDDEE